MIRSRTSEDLPEWTVTPALIDTVMYAGAMWEFQRLHFDEQWAHREGLPGPIVQGPLLGNYLVRTVEEGMDGRYEVSRVDWRNLATVRVGDTLTCGGTVDHGPGGEVSGQLWITNEGTVVVRGTATLRRRAERAR